jgi:hypothetical protein
MSELDRIDHDVALRARLRAIGAFAQELDAPGFEAGHWHPSEPTREDPSVSTMGWYELSPRAEAFVRSLGPFMVVFDWPAWAATDEAQALHGDRAVLAAATSDQLSRLVTAVVREDRFNEGALGDSFDSGLMAAIARHAAALAGDADDAG